MDEVHGRLGVEKSYRAIAEYLRQAIESDQYHCGDRLPSEKELSSLFGVSRSSVREALTALEYVGLIEVRGGSGYYVAGNKPIAPEELARQCYAKIIVCAEAGWSIKTLTGLLQQGLDGLCLQAAELSPSAWPRQLRAIWQAAHDAAALTPVLAEVSPRQPELAERVRLLAAAKIDGVIIAGVQIIDDVLAVRQSLDAVESRMQVFALCGKLSYEKMRSVVRASDGLIFETSEWEMRDLTEGVRLCALAGKQAYLAVRLEETVECGASPGGDVMTRAVATGCDGVYVRTGKAAQKYPADGLSLLRHAAREAQGNLTGRGELTAEGVLASQVANALCAAAAQAAATMNAVAFVVPTETGLTPRLLAKYHQGPPILAVTQNPQVARRLRLVWGVKPLLSRRTMRQESVMQLSVDTCLQAGCLQDGDSVVGVIGNMDVQDSRHSIQLITVGDVLLRGQGVGEGIVCGRVALLRSRHDLNKRVAGKIIVAAATDAEHVPLIEAAAGLIVEDGGYSSHAAISCLALGKPAIIGAADAAQLLLEDEQITMDIMRGLIFRGWVNWG
ncbi:MAG: pyruvate kinase alpha/beta domain-containing protein [Sporomusaceae bacterium]|nr:pyruvate kinase alpha/beta domain-containing protein [Sporomusaceae bacterium]